MPLATYGRLPVGVITGHDNDSYKSTPNRRVPADPVLTGLAGAV